MRSTFAFNKLDNFEINLDESKKAGNFYTELTKFRNSNGELFKKTEAFFKKLELPLEPSIQYSDDEKLCFCLNYYNFKLLHQLFFRESSFPKEYCHWRQLVGQTKFILFGYPEMPLFFLDQAVIRYLFFLNNLKKFKFRQFLDSQYLFYIVKPPTEIFAKNPITHHVLDRVKFPFFAREHRRIDDEVLLNFCISFHLK